MFAPPTRNPRSGGRNAADAKLKSLGNVTTEFYEADGEAHRFFNKQPWRDLTFIESDKFLSRLGLLEGAPTLAVPAGDAEIRRADE